MRYEPLWILLLSLEGRAVCVIRVLKTQGGPSLTGDIGNCLQSRSFEEGEGIEDTGTLGCLCEFQLPQGEHSGHGGRSLHSLGES